MKKLIILLFHSMLILTLIMVSSASDIEFPSLIDFGNCNIGNVNMSALYMKPFPIVNNSDSEVFIQGVNIVYNYPSSITHKGNYFGLFGQTFQYASQESIIKPKDTAYYTAVFFSKYVDSISQFGNLEVNFIYFYRIGNDLQTLTKEISVHAKALNNNQIFTLGKNYFEIINCQSELNKKINVTYPINIFNNSIDKFIIDSFKVIRQDLSYNQIGFNKYGEPTIKNLLELPIEIDKDSSINFWIEHIQIKDEVALFHAQFYLHNKTTNELLILEDSIKIKVKLYPDIKIYNSGSVLYTEYKQTITYGRVSIRSCALQNTFIDSISFTNEWDKDELTFLPDVEFPFYITCDSLFRLGKLNFFGKYIGLKRGYMLLHFRDSEGHIFQRYFSQQTFVEEPLGIPNDTFNSDDIFVIFPNPTNGNIAIKTDLILPAKISVINLLGEKIIQTDLKEQEMQLDLTGIIQNGVYFIILENKISKFVKKLIVNN